MKILIVTDAWKPQVNGVVTTLSNTVACLRRDGHVVELITPAVAWSVPCPSYPEIRLSLFAGRRVARQIRDFAPDSIHIATEGPLGYAARRHCRRLGLAFSTSYHTQFPQYVRARLPIPLRWTYAALRRFHGAAVTTMVGTSSQRDDLIANGFRNVEIWPRGADTNAFRPGDKDFVREARPILMYMGRVAVEKNLEAFLGADLPGTKYVVGDGPALASLRQRYPDAVYTGYQFGENLTRYLGAADVFVFPSRTDTLGLVMLEAMACGVPVAAYPVTGPIDVVEHGVTGCLSENIEEAVHGALKLDPVACREAAMGHSWRNASRTFFSHLVRVGPHAESGTEAVSPTLRHS